ncbi:MAG: DUF1127 domain-containing protein [Pseudomonadota bacterium]
MAHIDLHSGWGGDERMLPELRGFGTLLARVSRYREARRRRAAFRMLSSLEPWQLEDIGLSVEDVDWGLVLPMETDALAAAKARARRRGRGPAGGSKAPAPTDTPVTHVHIGAPRSVQQVARGRMERPWVMGT